MSEESHESHGEAAHENHDKTYYKIFAWLTFWTLLELGWADWFATKTALLLIGLSIMAGIKASMVGLYYMHLKWETKPIWLIIAFPIVLCIIMIAGLSPDAIGYWR
ncbi:MAG: cytochrome C oxidase subunit IV family protein [Planctomycetota bacterium]|jgi:cytochrome c oxidase subunit 4